MTRNASLVAHESAGEVLAEFGSAALVLSASGHVELQGGTGADVGEAREWASLFLDREYVAWRPALG